MGENVAPQPAHLQETVRVPCTGEKQMIGPAGRHIQGCAACNRWLYIQAANGTLPDAYWRWVDDAIERETPDPSPESGEAPFEVVDNTSSRSPDPTTTPSASPDGRRDDRGTRPGEPSPPSDDPGQGQGFQFSWVTLAHRPLPASG